MADEDPKHLDFIRSQPCALHGPECQGSIAPHHATFGRGLSQRAHDHCAMPLCFKHHFELHAGIGHFADWDHEKRTAWQQDMVEIYRPKNQPDVF